MRKYEVWNIINGDVKIVEAATSFEARQQYAKARGILVTDCAARRVDP